MRFLLINFRYSAAPGFYWCALYTTAGYWWICRNSALWLASITPCHLARALIRPKSSYQEALASLPYVCVLGIFSGTCHLDRPAYYALRLDVRFIFIIALLA